MIRATFKGNGANLVVTVMEPGVEPQTFKGLDAEKLAGTYIDKREAEIKAAVTTPKAGRGVFAKLLALGEMVKYDGKSSPRKGNIGVYGFSSKGFPTTLYAAQWPALHAQMPAVAGIILDPVNKGKIAYRSDAERESAEVWARSMVAPVT